MTAALTIPVLVGFVIGSTLLSLMLCTSSLEGTSLSIGDECGVPATVVLYLWTLGCIGAWLAPIGLAVRRRRADDR